MDIGFLGLPLLAIWTAGSLYHSPIFPYSPTLLPSSRSVLYLLSIHTFLLEPVVIDHEGSLEPTL